jgi:hypothetical protein
MFNAHPGKILSRLAPLLFAFAIGGCASTPAYVGAAIKAEHPEDAGRVVGSIAFSLDGDPTYMRYSLAFRKRGGAKDEAGFIAVSNTMWDAKESFDVVDAKLKGKTFDLQLRPGKYEIYQVYMSSDTGTVSTGFSAREPFSVPFSVSRGETLYLGQFLHRGTWGKNRFGMKVPADSYFLLSDESARDIPLLKRRIAGLDEGSVIRGVPRVTGSAALFIRTLQ